VAALEGRFLAVDEALGREPGEALEMARAWWAEQPGDVLAALALGRGLAAVGQRSAAARAYGSLIDLAPSRAEFRRHAGQRLESVGALELAVDSYREAVLLRPDHEPVVISGVVVVRPQATITVEANAGADVMLRFVAVLAEQLGQV